MSIRTICTLVKIAFLVKKTWTWICGNIPNYNNTIGIIRNTIKRHPDVDPYETHKMMREMGY